jgi:localization factor PodJL
MSGAAPWSVKGIEPRTREAAKDLARRSGMTLGEWLSEMISENSDSDFGSDRRRQAPRRLDDAYAIRGEDATAALSAIEALSSRIEGAERRSTLAIDGVDRAVSGLVRRLEATEGEASARDRRFEELSDSVRESRTRLRRFEDETGPRYTEAFGKIEGALGKLAGQFYESEARGRDASTALRDRLDRLEREASPDRLADGVVSRVAHRLEEAQGRTALSLAKLEQSFADLDRRLAQTERGGGQREGAGLEKIAEALTRKVEESRNEMMRRLDGAAQDGRMDRVERALVDLGAHLQASERRQAQALEAMGHEVMRIAANLDGRLKETEHNHENILNASQERALKAVETMGQELSKSLGSDVARVAEAIEHRLKKADDHHAIALEKLGGEIARISERLAERIAQGERRAAEGVNDLADRLNRASEKMETRYDRASGELAERMRQSEERTARLLAEARESIDRQLQRRGNDDPAADWSSADFPSSAFEPDWNEPTAAGFPSGASHEPAEDVFAPPSAIARPAPAPAPAPSFPEAAPPPVFVSPDPEADFAEFATAGTQAIEPEFTAFAAAPTFEPAPPVAVAPAGAPGPFMDAFDDPATDLDAFDPDTEFLTDRHGRAERPLSTREAIEAARAATRRGEAAAEEGGEARKSFGFRLGGGKSRLQKRVEKQSRREGSTLGKALLATTTAVVLVGGGVAGVMGYQRLVEQGSAIPGLPAPGGDALAASAVGPSEIDIAPPAAEAQAEGQALFDQALPLIEAGDAEGVRLMSRAANLGFPQAQLALGRLYETGEAGVTADPAEARRWTERAARGGDQRAMHNLAMYLFDGVGGARDQVQAARWFQAAAERGLVDSQYNLARLFEQGAEGLSPDPARAYQWYLIAGRSGDAGAEEQAARLRADIPASSRLEAEAEAERFLSDVAQG